MLESPDLRIASIGAELWQEYEKNLSSIIDFDKFIINKISIK